MPAGKHKNLKKVQQYILHGGTTHMHFMYDMYDI
jgi:hypothetical protein